MRFIKRLLCLVLTLLTVSSSLVFVGETKVKAATRPVMDPDNAIMFIGFITNEGKHTKERITSSIIYDLLTGTYSGPNEEEMLFTLNFLIRSSTQQMSDQANSNKEYHVNQIVSYLEKHVPSNGSINLAESVINEQRNHYMNILVEGLTSMVDSVFGNSGSFFTAADAFNAYSTITGAYKKAETIVDYTMAGIHGMGLVFESEYAGRYGYFQKYLALRPGWSESDMYIFEDTMEMYRELYSMDNYFSGFLDLLSFVTNKDSFSNHYETLDNWAEFTYQLGEYVNPGGSSQNYIPVTSVSFSQDACTFWANGSLTLKPTLYPSNANQGTELSYTSSDTSVLTVSNNGTIYPVAPGQAYVHVYTSNGFSDYCVVQILPYKAEGYNGQYAITDYLGQETDISIPGYVNNKRVMAIKDYAFENCTSIKTLSLPDTITTIHRGAFSQCTNLEKIFIPDSVDCIDGDAFYRCTNLKSIYIDNLSNWCNITFYNQLSNPLCYADNMYINGTLTTSITIPSNVIHIYDYAFCEFENLKSVTFHNKVQSIGRGTFEGCHSLTSISMPDSITTIGEWAFASCTSLKNITFSKNLTVIPDYAFLSCESLTSVSIPSNITEIRTRAFYSTGLTSFSFPSKIKAIGTDVLGYCKNLKTAYIPNTVNSMGDGTFTNCTSLTSVNFPNTINFIPCSTFYNCTSLTSVVIPDKVSKIKGYAFYGCSNLSSVKLPENTKTIEERAFYGCKNLKNIHIPKNVSLIESKVFGECTNLENITVSPDNVNYDSRNNCNAIIETSTNTLLFGSTKTTVPDDITSIKDWAFYNRLMISTLTVPESLTYLDSYSMYSDNLDMVVVKNPDAQFASSLTTSSDTTICGYQGSTAEAYAISNNRSFIPLIDSIDFKTRVIATIDSNTTFTCNKINSVVNNPVVPEFEYSIADSAYSFEFSKNGKACDPSFDVDVRIPASKSNRAVYYVDSQNKYTELSSEYKNGYLSISTNKGGCFVVTKPLTIGDTNKDGVISIMDATLIQLKLASLIDLSTSQANLADTNLDNNLTIFDVANIQNYLIRKQSNSYISDVVQKYSYDEFYDVFSKLLRKYNQIVKTGYSNTSVKNTINQYRALFENRQLATDYDIYRSFEKCETAYNSIKNYSISQLYLQPNIWDKDNAAFAAYFFNSSGYTWAEMEKCKDGRFSATIPNGYTDFLFVRLNPSGGLDWSSMWNQTYDLKVSKERTYSISDWGEEKSTGNWK